MTARYLFALALSPLLFTGGLEDRQPASHSSRQAPQRAPAPPRPPGVVSVEQAIALTNGWARLAEGQSGPAADAAQALLAKHPRSAAALAFAVDATIARSGAAAALGQDETWLGSRLLDEPLAVRRIAHAMLWEEASQRQDVMARVEALNALASDGDPAAAAELSKAVSSGSPQSRSRCQRRPARRPIADWRTRARRKSCPDHQRPRRERQ